MKMLILAAAAALSITAGTAYAESGENYGWAYSPNVPTHTTPAPQPRAAVQPTGPGAVIAPANTTTYNSGTNYYPGADYNSGPLNVGSG